MIARHRYTVEEVNEHLPEVTRRWAAALELRAQCRMHQARVEAAGHPSSQRANASGQDAGGREAADKVPASASADVRRDHAVLLALREALRDELAAIGITGCVIRDLDTGLCDWLGEHNGRDVWLCWRVGEPECAWFHDLDAGFAGRRPISELTVTPAELPPARARR